MIFLILFYIALDAHSASEYSSDESVESNGAEYLLSNQTIIRKTGYDSSSSDDESEARNPRSQVRLLSRPVEDEGAEKINLLEVQSLLETFLTPISKICPHYTLDAMHDVIEKTTVIISQMLPEQRHHDEEHPLDLKTFLTNLQPDQLDLKAFFYIFSALKEVYASVSSKHSDREALDKQYIDACALLVSSLQGFFDSRENPFKEKFREFKQTLNPLI
ncbi:MAG: hypothetical protein OXC30_03395 [Alphaproteobacteria bacterium]|nr:hypothetical protein [Alphaproteobacteria bacterium]